jgi:hypothetical protein
MTFLKTLFGGRKREINEITSLAHPLRDAICASLSSKETSVQKISQSLKNALNGVSLT